VKFDLTITYNAAGDPYINIPAEVATSLVAGESLPTISLVFSGAGKKKVDFDTAVFTDPLS